MDPPESDKHSFRTVFLKPAVEEEGEYEAVKDVCLSVSRCCDIRGNVGGRNYSLRS